MNEQKTILLVEDEALIAIMEKQALKKHGFNVIVAHSGENAIEIVGATPDIDLILMDINLGKGMDGTEAAQIILKEREIPVLFLSSYTQAEVVEKTEKITSYGYVVKDSGETVLIASIKMAFKLHDAHRKVLEKEEALQASEEKYRSIFENAIEGIFQGTSEGRIITANPAHARIHGYDSPEDMINSVTDVGRQLYVDQVQRNTLARLVIEKGVIENYEAQMYRKDGTRIWVSINMRAVRDSSGNVQFFEGTVVDITERKRAEAELEKTLNMLISISESSTDAVYIKDIQGRYLLFNREAARVTNKNQKEVIGKDDYFLFPDDEAKTVMDGDRRVMESGKVMTYEENVTTHMGRMTTFLSTKGPIFDEDGNKIGLFGVARDITERKLAEEKIKTLLTEKELFLKEVHHRVKNNMSVIMSLLSLQSRALKNRAAIAALEDSRNRVQSMMVLYDKLYRSADFRGVSAKEYLTSLADAIVINFPNRGSITIESQIDEVILDAATLSPVGIILNELLTNAMKYAFIGRDNGVIAVSFSIKDNHAAFIVQDNGAGIPESIDIASSTGFGLQLVGILTDQLEGSMMIEREKGTKFILEFDV